MTKHNRIWLAGHLKYECKLYSYKNQMVCVYQLFKRIMKYLEKYDCYDIM